MSIVFPREAFVSQIHYHYVSLQDLVRRSPYIFVVKRAQPDSTIIKIPIHQDRDKHPDFTHVTFHYEIIQTLRGPKELSPGQKIDVLPANSDEEFSLHKEYYLEQLSVSPIYDSYRSGVDPNAAPALIIFVGLHDEKRFQLIATNACEDVGRKEEILKMMKGGDQENTAR
jgi:hypothetical protein